MMTCLSTGDPHIFTFGSYRCDLMGLGVFPLVELPGVKAETFHCPATMGWVGASTNVAVAISVNRRPVPGERVGADVVRIVGRDVTLNGMHIPSGVWSNDDVSIVHNGNGHVEVSFATHGVTLLSIKHSTSNIPAGYLQDIRVVTHEQATSGFPASQCAAENANCMQGVALGRTLFTAEQMTSLEGICGAIADPPAIECCGYGSVALKRV